MSWGFGVRAFTIADNKDLKYFNSDRFNVISI